ncbi:MULTISPECIES: hypothetical protein [unclassified Mesorhizobium]|uniref:hypothetical protein n=1 Tax=unclassified Mesorhizobium TaxID=325217 RepID=UPI0033388502
MRSPSSLQGCDGVFFKPSQSRISKLKDQICLQAVAAIVRRIGFDEGRVGAVARILTDAAVLPPGAPWTSPDLSPQDVASLMLGAALDVPLRAVVDAVRDYRALRREGVPDGAPFAISVATTGEELDVLAEIAATGSPEAKARAAKTIITVVNSWPEVVPIDQIDTRRFNAGAPSHWQASRHRKSVEINAAALVDVINELFGDQ